MEINYLRVFFEVAQAGSFTEAAKRLNISQSALSRSVSLLEDEAGVKLFERSKNGITLTATGNEIFRQCEQLFQIADRIEHTLKGVREVCEGPLRFATTDHIANYLMPQPLQAFRQKYSKVIPSISIGTPDEITDKLLKGHCEFSLSFAKVALPQIEFRVLREEPMSLVVNAQVWHKTKGTTQNEKLSKVLSNLGYITSVGADIHKRPSRVLRELFGKTPPIGIEIDGQEAQKKICLAGGGIAYLAQFMVAHEIELNLLHKINVEHPHSFKLWLATRKGKDLTLVSKAFIKQLQNIEYS